MELKHTPGPWMWGDNHNGLYGAGPDNEVLRYERYEGMWLTYGPSKAANASLIAAAPELLEALQNFVRDTEITLQKVGYSQQQIDTTPNFVKARAAIAKATGSKA